MKTPYDFITLALFAGLIVLFLQRSTTEAEDPHPMWQYLVPAVGCAVANWLGNEGHVAGAVLMVAATMLFILHMLEPFGPFPPKRG